MSTPARRRSAPIVNDSVAAVSVTVSAPTATPSVSLVLRDALGTHVAGEHAFADAAEDVVLGPFPSQNAGKEQDAAKASRKRVRRANIADDVVNSNSKPRKRPRKAQAAPEPIDPTTHTAAAPTSPVSSDLTPLSSDVEAQPIKQRQKRRARKDMEEADYPPRVQSKMLLGAHVSAAGGVENAVTRAAAIGANAFALFLKSQRKWVSPPISPDSIAAFKRRMHKYGYSPSCVIPHGSYLVNLGHPDAERREKAYQCFFEEIQRCEALGLTLFNFHPGSAVGSPLPEALANIAACLNRVHRETSSVITVLECMASPGKIGSRFADLAGIIAQVEDKSRVGVCLDTCHLFASGHDIRTKDAYEATIAEFDETVGLSKYLRAMHLNDSKGELGSGKDRHENIGLGHIGLPAFAHILRDPRLAGIPLILETPMWEQDFVWAREIKILYELEGAEQEEEADWDGRKARVEEVVNWAREEDRKKEEARSEKRERKRRKKAEAEENGEEKGEDRGGEVERGR